MNCSITRFPWVKGLRSIPTISGLAPSLESCLWMSFCCAFRHQSVSIYVAIHLYNDRHRSVYARNVVMILNGNALSKKSPGGNHRGSRITSHRAEWLLACISHAQRVHPESPLHSHFRRPTFGPSQSKMGVRTRTQYIASFSCLRILSLT